MKRIGLAIAAALLGTTGIASAGIAVHQFSLASDSQSTSLDAKIENLAANCWVATGAGKASGCNTALSSGGLPGLPDLDTATGLVKAQELVDTAQGLGAEVASAATGAATQAAGGLPVSCDVTAGVPSEVAGAVGAVVPKPVTDAVGQTLGTVASVTGTNAGVTSSGTAGIGCSANTSGAAGVAGTGAGIAGEAVNTATGAVTTAKGAVTTATDVAKGAVKTVTGAVTGATATAGTAGTGAVSGVTGTVESVTGTVSDTVGTVNNLLGGGLLNCSASGGVGTLLGGVTVSGTC